MNTIAAKAMDRERLFTSMPVKRAVLSLAVPTVISQLIAVVYNMADTFFICPLGADGATTAFCGSYLFWTVCIGAAPTVLNAADPVPSAQGRAGYPAVAAPQPAFGRAGRRLATPHCRSVRPLRVRRAGSPPI